MSSSLVYKFKASNQQYSVHFDGPHIQLSELRAQIIRDGKIAQGSDFFELELSNAQTGEVFGERALVPRNTAVLVRRVPLHKRAPLESKRPITAVNMSPHLAPSAHGAAAEMAADSPRVGEEGLAALSGEPSGEGCNPDPIEVAAPPRVARPRLHYTAKLLCPLSNALFVDAVIVTCCGTSFSKQPLEEHLARTNACPHCGTTTDKIKKLPNRSLREAVLKHLESSKAEAEAAEESGAAAGSERVARGVLSCETSIGHPEQQAIAPEQSIQAEGLLQGMGNPPAPTVVKVEGRVVKEEQTGAYGDARTGSAPDATNEIISGDASEITQDPANPANALEMSSNADGWGDTADVAGEVCASRSSSLDQAKESPSHQGEGCGSCSEPAFLSGPLGSMRALDAMAGGGNVAGIMGGMATHANVNSMGMGMAGHMGGMAGPCMGGEMANMARFMGGSMNGPLQTQMGAGTMGGGGSMMGGGVNMGPRMMGGPNMGGGMMGGSNMGRGMMGGPSMSGGMMGGGMMGGGMMGAANMGGMMRNANMAGGMMGGPNMCGGMMRNPNMCSGMMGGPNMCGGMMGGANMGGGMMGGANMGGGMMGGPNMGGMMGGGMMGGQNGGGMMRTANMCGGMIRNANMCGGMMGSPNIGAMMGGPNMGGGMMGGANMGGGMMGAPNMGGGMTGGANMGGGLLGGANMGSGMMGGANMGGGMMGGAHLGSGRACSNDCRCGMGGCLASNICGSGSMGRNIHAANQAGMGGPDVAEIDERTMSREEFERMQLDAHLRRGLQPNVHDTEPSYPAPSAGDETMAFRPGATEDTDIQIVGISTLAERDLRGYSNALHLDEDNETSAASASNGSRHAQLSHAADYNANGSQQGPDFGRLENHCDAPNSMDRYVFATNSSAVMDGMLDLGREQSGMKRPAEFPSSLDPPNKMTRMTESTLEG
ncbi:hypothetical protein AB1Y20_018705 [Prymnesium parvum]|uniref:DWNN domain-containing protein n=1 Tax=Prymnesium parvum TaxID=97485 RepID=A0AB34JS18_PRYPA